MLLRLAGCDEMQGYLFARPAPREALDRLVAEPAEGQRCAPPSPEPLTIPSAPPYNAVTGRRTPEPHEERA